MAQRHWQTLQMNDEPLNLILLQIPNTTSSVSVVVVVWMATRTANGSCSHLNRLPSSFNYENLTSWWPCPNEYISAIISGHTPHTGHERAFCIDKRYLPAFCCLRPFANHAIPEGVYKRPCGHACCSWRGRPAVSTSHGGTRHCAAAHLCGDPCRGKAWRHQPIRWRYQQFAEWRFCGRGGGWQSIVQ